MDNTKEYWKSLDEYAGKTNSEDLKKSEFLEGVTDEFSTEKMSKFSRRKFLALLTASSAFATASCSDYYDQGKLVPYTKRPEGFLPGKANYYASSCAGCSESCGILIKTREGRPIKIDGNPEHPISKGKVCAKGHASILNLYDPDRLKAPFKNGRKTNWKVVDKEIIAALNQAVEEKKKIVLVSKKIASPSYKSVIENFKIAYPTAEHLSYEVFNDLNRIGAWEKSYPSTPLPAIAWEKADVILSIDYDFLGREGNVTESTKRFSSRRDVMSNEKFNRLYVAEGALSLTGMNSDYRLRVRTDAYLDFVTALLNEIVLVQYAAGSNLNSDIKNIISKKSLKDFAAENNLDKKLLDYLVADLISNKGKAIVAAGDSQSEEVHLLVNLLNEILGDNKVYDFDAPFVTEKVNRFSDFKKLTDEINAGNVAALVYLNVDPEFHFPADLQFSKAAEKVPLKIALVESKNDTSAKAEYELPSSHYLESWGDSFTRANVYTFRQPVIAPLYNSRQPEEVLLTWSLKGAAEYSENIYHDFLKDNFQNNVYNKKNLAVSFEKYWLTALHDGFVSMETETPASLKFNADSLSGIKYPKGKSKFVLSLKPSYFIGDGEYANNGWLQELPHPVSKVTWDNYAAVSPSMAKELDLENNDKIKISANNISLEMPILIQPGTADNQIEVELGYGRKIVGAVGRDTGFNANVFLNSSGNSWVISGVEIEKTGGTYKIVSTQEHHSLDDEFVKDLHLKRGIIQGGTISEYEKNPNFIQEEKPEVFSITTEHEYNGVKWAMAIDMNKCTSCAVCVASCNVENNVPVVGKDQVAVGREMQWMRLDRYYSGTPDAPIVSGQPMLCQHCDFAPCENVCPVNATNHSPDGLNQMVYNRCVGTRYCANNCPYKVRRFNFFNFRDHFEDAYYLNEVTPLVHNPEVTVRSRGVMEKCTFCVQRISEARSEAKAEGREFKGDDVVVACQQSCPADAIVFGDSNDMESKVSKYREHQLGYHVLEETAVKPNVTYIAKLRNTHSEEA
ncbi:MAG: TAT-variant-translocated molybdopterin oxidoreductase [Chlorobi bacterium]|nr:TAT-variant-translocated molybdopterin oxidoreductase [Chlorobiota bacterium]